MKTTASLSWSQMQDFNKCNRRWMLSYVENLEAIPTKESLPLYRGSMYHRAIEVYLQTFNVQEAIEQAQTALKLLTIPNKLRYDYEIGDHVVDLEYYEMVNGLHADMPDILAYHLPNIGLGTKYRVATTHEVLGCTCQESECICLNEPMLEYEFDLEGVHGFIDAVLWDIENEYYVVVDWKMYTRQQNDMLYEVDGQLHLYASVLRKLGANVGDVIMWRFRASAPKPAKMNQATKKKPAMPSIASQTTTWEHWCDTLPYGLEIDLDDWYEIMVEGGKLKGADFFMNKVESPVTEDSCEMTMLNVEAIAEGIDHSLELLEDGKILPANLSQYSCEWCPFMRLCAMPFRYAQDPTIMIDQYYQQKQRVNLKVRE